jgi:hypothetical protein
MKSFKRIVPYLILNILVSAATTLAVLWLWGSSQPSKPDSVVVIPPPPAVDLTTVPDGTLSPNTAAGDQAAPKANAPLPPSSQPIIEIQNVFGAGDLKTEVLRVKRVGEGEVWLTGWKLKDTHNHTFTFPELLLNKDGAVEIYTRSGSNSVIELHWGLDNPVWVTGEKATVFDSQGVLRAEYTIP